MATLLELARNDDGPLFKYDPELDFDEQELRAIYTTAKLRDWIRNTLPTLRTYFDEQSMSPLDQFEELVWTFCAGLPLTFKEQFKPFHRKPLGSAGGGVWYLITLDLRIFGWFPVRDCFVGVVADDYSVKEKELYEGYRNEVLHCRSLLQLNEPKFIPGEDPYVVVSNCDFPRPTRGR